MIYKLQRSLIPRDEVLLIKGTDDNNFFQQIPMNDEALALFGDELRIFVDAEIINGEFTINAVVEAPDAP